MDVPDGPEHAHLRFQCVDGYSTGLPRETLAELPLWLVWEMNGVPLPRKHGFPARDSHPGSLWVEEPEAGHGIRTLNRSRMWRPGSRRSPRNTVSSRGRGIMVFRGLIVHPDGTTLVVAEDTIYILGKPMPGGPRDVGGYLGRWGTVLQRCGTHLQPGRRSVDLVPVQMETPTSWNVRGFRHVSNRKRSRNAAGRSGYPCTVHGGDGIPGVGGGSFFGARIFWPITGLQLVPFRRYSIDGHSGHRCSKLQPLTSDRRAFAMFLHTWNATAAHGLRAPSVLPTFGSLVTGDILF